MMKKHFVIIILIIFSIPSVQAQKWDLQKCLSYAEINNKLLLSKSYDIENSEVQRKEASAKLLPTLNISADIDYYWKLPVQSYPGELIGQKEGTTVAIPIGDNWMGSYSLELNSKIIDHEAWQAIKIRELKLQMSKYSMKSLMLTLFKNVTISYYSAQINCQQLDISLKQYNNYIQIHKLVNEKYTEGIIDKIELNQSQSILNEYDAHYQSCLSRYYSSLVELKYWMGYHLDEEILIDELNIPTFSSFQYDESLLPDIEEQKAKTELAKQEYEYSKSRFFPKLSFVANYGQVGFADKINTMTRSSSWYTSGFIGFKLSIPILNSPDFHKTKSKKIEMHQSLSNFQDYQYKQKKNTIQYLTDIKYAMHNIDIQNNRLELERENEQLNLQKIELGIIDMIQLRQIQKDLISIQEILKNAQLSYLKLYVEINYLQSKSY